MEKLKKKNKYEYYIIVCACRISFSFRTVVGSKIHCENRRSFHVQQEYLYVH